MIGEPLTLHAQEWRDGLLFAVANGSHLAELVARLGHSTPGAALRYQHAAQARDIEIANALSAPASPTAAD